MPVNTRGSDLPAGVVVDIGGEPTMLQRVEAYSDLVDSVMHGGVNPFSAVIDSITSPVEATVNGRKAILFGTNSYLGLNFHPDCIAAATAAIHSHGTGSTASRVAGGNSREHVDLEADIAAFYDRRHAMVYSTGFMANLGVIATLARRGDTIFFDSHCHASIIDACRLSGARLRPFRHNDPAHLERAMTNAHARPGHSIVIVEGVYSVWGDIADLRNILSIAKRRGALTIVDEAHGFGLFGEHGRGVAEALGVEDQADIIIGTLSKSAGVIGGFSVTNLDQLQTLRLMARSYLYTASLPPAAIGAARTAISLMATDKSLRQKVWANAELMRAGLERAGLPITASSSMVGSLPLPDMHEGLAFWKELLARGIYVNVLMPPATPDQQSVLRFSVSASHTPEHIATAVAAFADVWHARATNGAAVIQARMPAERTHASASVIALRSEVGA